MLLASQIGALLSSGLLLGAFILAYRRYPTDFGWYWLAGWTAYVARFGLEVTATVRGSAPYVLSVATNAATATSAILLFLAVVKLRDNPRSYHRMAASLWLVLLGWIGISPLLTERFILIHAPQAVTFGFIQLWTAYIFYTYLRERSYASTPIIVGSMALWGLHKLDFPILRPIDWFAPYGYVIGAVLALLTGIGVVMFLLEEAERESRERAKRITFLTDILQAMRSVNQRLVTAEDREQTVTDIAAILSESPAFGCVFITLLDGEDVDFVCADGTQLRETDVRNFHTQEYIESVTANGALVMEDVTAPPFRQHNRDLDSHRGVACRIGHDSRDLGILTVHLPPGDTLGDRLVDMLTELADDIGFTLHSLQIAREREQAITRLREQEAELFQKTRAVDEAPIGIVITDPQEDDNPIVYANDEAAALTGYTRAEMLGRNCRFLQGEHTDPAKREAIRRAIDAREPISIDIRNYRKEGTEFWNHLEIAPVENGKGEVINFVGFQQDITERKSRDQHLRLTDRLLRHNLRNELTVIRGSAETIVETTDNSVAEHAEQVVERSDDLLAMADKARLINHILRTNPEKTRIQLQSVLEEITSTVDKEYSEAELSVSSNGGASVEAIPLLEAGLTEVIENAILHNPDGKPQVDIDISEANGFVHLAISDNGPGIPQIERQAVEGAQKIDPLNHSNGLGLWLVNWIVKESGGSFAISNADAEGSTVTIELPAASGHSQ